jgi:hypothetical protein
MSMRALVGGVLGAALFAVAVWAFYAEQETVALVLLVGGVLLAVVLAPRAGWRGWALGLGLTLMVLTAGVLAFLFLVVPGER